MIELISLLSNMLIIYVLFNMIRITFIYNKNRNILNDHLNQMKFIQKIRYMSRMLFKWFPNIVNDINIKNEQEKQEEANKMLEVFNKYDPLSLGTNTIEGMDDEYYSTVAILYTKLKDNDLSLEIVKESLAEAFDIHVDEIDDSEVEPMIPILQDRLNKGK